MLVLAGPGSGKTYTITKRISYLIEHHKVEPQHILVVTFTKEAAMNMQNRFLCDAGVLYPVVFGTFHAIFYQMLKSSGCRQAEAILTDSDKKRYIFPILTDHYTNSPTDEDAVRCLAAISFYKNTNNLERALEMIEEPYRCDFNRILDQYEQKCIQNRRMDFDDMLCCCQKMLEADKKVLLYWQDRFVYLLIDEYQDINPRQNEIIRLLAQKNRNLFAVGDDDQSIYGFRGADPVLMKRFLTEYPDCRQVTLNINYRSIPEIVDISGRVIRQNKDRFAKNMRAVRERSEKQTIFIKGFTDKQMQYHYLATVLKKLSLQVLGGTAMLFRTNLQMQSFASVLTRAEIPYRMKEKGRCIYDHFIAKDVSSYFLFAGGDRRRSLFFTIMNKPYRGIGREMLEEEQVSLEKLRAYYRKCFSGQELAKHLLTLGELEDGLKKIANLKPYLGLQYLRRGMGYEAYLRRRAGTDSKKLGEWLEVLDFLGNEAGAFWDHGDWIQYQEAFRQKMKEKAGRQEGEGVHLMTVHASKGLEFDSVWIPDLNEGMYPYGHMQSRENVEEERRLLYVAMTRAKNSLGMTYVTGTQERPRLVSRFITPILNDL